LESKYVGMQSAEMYSVECEVWCVVTHSIGVHEKNIGMLDILYMCRSIECRV
jgi:hypothetical protein